MIERPRLLNALVVVKLRTVELETVAGEVDIGLAERSKVGPRDWVEHLGVETIVLLDYHLCV